MDISKLYPHIHFPVSRGTPMISPIIKWNHEEDHFVPYHDSYNNYERRNIVINISDKKYEFLQGHVVDGRVLFPATGWIYLVWETFSYMNGTYYEEFKVVFENVHFLEALPLFKDQDVLITISIHRGTGRFEVIEGNSAIAHGFIKKADNIEMSEIKTQSSKDGTFSQEWLYKEMRLCGFVYFGPFKGVTEMDESGLQGKIKWMNNWTTFLDTVTHFNNKRALLMREMGLPTRVRKFVIDPILHYKIVDEKIKKSKENADIIFDVEVCPYREIIRAGGIELHGKTVQVVNRRRTNQPSLEVSKFVPFFTEEIVTMEDAAKIIVQMIIENSSQIKFSTLEIDDNRIDEKQLLSEHLQKAVSEIPQMTSDITLVTSRNNFYLKGINISSEDLSSFRGIDLHITSKFIGGNQALEEIMSVMSNNGYIVSREDQVYCNISNINYQIVAKIRTTSDEILHILRFTNDGKDNQNYKIIQITPNVEEWLKQLKNSLKESPTIIFAYNIEPSGILGFFNCLKQEFLDKLKCFLIIDTQHAPSVFDISNRFFNEQLKHNHAINVFKIGKWGSYKYFDIPKIIDSSPQSSHCYANCRIRGDLSTLSWLHGPLNIQNPVLDLVKIQYSSLNFKDVMLALGRISETTKEAVARESFMGFEFSGTKRNGERVMGIGVNAGALATHYDPARAIFWRVPDSWTLEEAATVPLVYFTVYFAFFNTTTIKAGKKILIHSGSGGVGLAAIEVAFAYGLEVFTTVSIEEKKNFLLKRFPKLKPENIGNSRNTTFEKMVLENTQGKGVDYVLNSLSGDKLQASIRCLGVDGVFLEIGKYDIQMGTSLDIGYLEKRITIKTVIFDDLSVDSDDMQVSNVLIYDF